MLKQNELISSFQSLSELIILKILEANKDSEKDVDQAAGGCAAAMVGIIVSSIVGIL